jgi:D-glycero-D-manno-heptose 1,7-bisphosphate phosphatase
MKKAVFLDRDGVLNEALVRDGRPYSPRTLEEFVIVAGASDELGLLRRHGYRLVVVTNQPDIARGKMAREELEDMHRYLLQRLPIDAIEVCEHDDADRCACRKPLPGLLTHAAQRDGIALAKSFMIGDRWRDIEAGRSAGCRTVLIGDGYREGLKSQPDIAVGNLGDAVRRILVT